MQKKFIFLFLIGFLLLALPNLQVAGDESHLFLITDINKDSFPDIQVSFRVVDAHGRTVEDIKEEDIDLYENKKPITDFQLTRSNDSPVNIIYVIDLGQFTNYSTFGVDDIRRAITFPILNGYFQNGEDSVQLLGRVYKDQQPQTILLIDPSSDGDAFLNRVNSMSFNRGPGLSEALGGIEDALKEVTNADSQHDSFTSIVFLTHLLDTLSDEQATAFAEGLIVTAIEKRIPIYTFQTRIGGEDTQALTLLSRETGGEYLRLINNEDQREDFQRIFEDITNQRTHYSLTYRSTSSISDNRKVSIGPSGTSVEDMTGLGFYEVNLESADIEIDSPANNTILPIDLHFGDEDEVILQPATSSISAHLIGWSDNYPRQITSATLFVNNEPVTNIETSPNDTSFNFTWNIKDIQDDGTIPLVFSVMVLDELGMESKSDPVTVNLVVTKWSSLEYCKENLFSSRCLSLLLPIIIIFILFVAVSAFLFFNLMTRSRKSTFHRTFRTPRETVFVPGKKEKVSPEALAWIKVLEGPVQMQDLDLEIRDFVTHLGRDPEQSTISFYSEGNTSISGKHCTLEFYNDTFYITDNHSLNGTTLNDEELEPDKSYKLNDGDLIELGDLSVRGVKLRFTIPKVTKESLKKDDTFYGNREETSG